MGQSKLQELNTAIEFYREYTTDYYYHLENGNIVGYMALNKVKEELLDCIGSMSPIQLSSTYSKIMKENQVRLEEMVANKYQLLSSPSRMKYLSAQYHAEADIIKFIRDGRFGLECDTSKFLKDYVALGSPYKMLQEYCAFATHQRGFLTRSQINKKNELMNGMLKELRGAIFDLDEKDCVELDASLVPLTTYADNPSMYQKNNDLLKTVPLTAISDNHLFANTQNLVSLQREYNWDMIGMYKNTNGLFKMAVPILELIKENLTTQM